MIETVRGLRETATILDTHGVDGVFLGPYDLSLSLGAASPADPVVIDAIRTVIDSARARRLVCGLYSGDSPP